MDLLELMAPMKHFSKLRDFLNNKLPQGFPIKVGQYHRALFTEVLYYLKINYRKTPKYFQKYR